MKKRTCFGPRGIGTCSRKPTIQFDEPGYAPVHACIYHAITYLWAVHCGEITAAIVVRRI